jgi:hypothetical protein
MNIDDALATHNRQSDYASLESLSQNIALQLKTISNGNINKHQSTKLMLVEVLWDSRIFVSHHRHPSSQIGKPIQFC